MTQIVTISATVVLAALSGLAVRWWLVIAAVVKSSSMEPTLRPGQRLFVRRLHGVHRVARGDVVLVDSTEVGEVIIKRAVGLPGERISVERDGRVWVDGEQLLEPYAARGFGPAGAFAVPANSLFVLGDNRSRSSDSRTWQQPYVPASTVLGKVIRLGS